MSKQFEIAKTTAAAAVTFLILVKIFCIIFMKAKTLKTYLSKKESKPRGKPNKKDSNSRYIPKAIRHAVFKRDKNCCTFISPDGKRCSERMKLQVDHIKPYAMGGDSVLENLRLLCPSHNLLLAERSFGREKIKVYTR